MITHTGYIRRLSVYPMSLTLRDHFGKDIISCNYREEVLDEVKKHFREDTYVEITVGLVDGGYFLETIRSA